MKPPTARCARWARRRLSALPQMQAAGFQLTSPDEEHCEVDGADALDRREWTLTTDSAGAAAGVMVELRHIHGSVTMD